MSSQTCNWQSITLIDLMSEALKRIVVSPQVSLKYIGLYLLNVYIRGVTNIMYNSLLHLKAWPNNLPFPYENIRNRVE